VHVGDAGCGQATKLCNNLLTGIHMAALAESVALAEREGLDPHRLFRVLTSGTADSSVLRRRYPVPGVVPEAPSSHDFAALFPAGTPTAVRASTQSGSPAQPGRAAVPSPRCRHRRPGARP